MDNVKVYNRKLHLDDILKLIEFPSCKVDLIFCDVPLVDRFGNKNQGAFTSAKLLEYAVYCKMHCNDDPEESWDYCILISSDSWRFTCKYPGYFTYLLAHEFGHVKLYLHSFKAHLLCCLVYEFIENASKGKIRCS